MRLVCGGDRREALVRESKDGLHVTVDGRAFAMGVEEVAPGTFVLREGERNELFYCVRDGDDVHLFWKGAVYRLAVEREGGRAAQRHAGGGLEAPMPGKVIKVNVEPGGVVSKGDEILVIEAMKMENAIRAPRDGTVRSVAAKVGDMVNPGVVLVELE